jgi:hypothetical protein
MITMKHLQELQDLNRMIAILAPTHEWSPNLAEMCDRIHIPGRTHLSLELQRRFQYLLTQWAKSHLLPAIEAARADMRRELETQLQDLLPETIATLAKLYHHEP